MLFFRRTRKAGAAAVIAIAFGAVLSNLLLKNAIARPRPFHTVDSPFYAFWTEAGSLQVGEYVNVYMIDKSIPYVLWYCQEKAYGEAQMSIEKNAEEILKERAR